MSTMSMTGPTNGARSGWAVTCVRWSARLLSVLVMVVVMAFAFGENGTPTARDILMIALFPVGVVAGLLIAWFREGLGAVISLGSLAVVFAIGAAKGHSFAGLGGLALFGVPGALFALCAVVDGWRRR